MNLPIVSTLLILTSIACISQKKTIFFHDEYSQEDYHHIASEKGIENEKWIDRLYDYQVNIKNFDKFKATGVDLTVVYGRDYKSRALLSEIIVEGKILSKTENPATNVKFHSEYLVAVSRVLRKQHWDVSDTIKVKMISGPIGDRYLATTSGSDRYYLGEDVLLYLEPMERTFSYYDELKAAQKPLPKSTINADRSDLNIYRPLKKYVLKEGYVYHRDIGKIGKQAEVRKGLKKVLSLNEIHR